MPILQRRADRKRPLQKLPLQHAQEDSRQGERRGRLSLPAEGVLAGGGRVGRTPQAH